MLIVAADDARRLTSQSQFELDCTTCGSHYRSDKYLHVKIHAERQG